MTAAISITAPAMAQKNAFFLLMTHVLLPHQILWRRLAGIFVMCYSAVSRQLGNLDHLRSATFRSPLAVALALSVNNNSQSQILGVVNFQNLQLFTLLHLRNRADVNGKHYHVYEKAYPRLWKYVRGMLEVWQLRGLLIIE
jgi:hypothetical protein